MNTLWKPILKLPYPIKDNLFYNLNYF